jgi:hypothetical protein
LPTNAELDAIVANLKVEIVRRPEAGTRAFRTFTDLRDFFNEERLFWSTPPLAAVQSLFNEIFTLLVQASNSNEVNTANNLISRAIGNASNANDAALIYSSTARGKLLHSLADEDAESAKAALACFSGGLGPSPQFRNSTPLSSSKGLRGVIAAMVHGNPDLFSGSMAAEAQAFAQQRVALYGFRENT